MIVVVDDDRDAADVLVRLLATAGLRASAINCAAELFAHLEREPTELIIVDVNMPGTDGLGCLRHVRTHAKSAEIPVIMYSADFSHERMREALRLGAQEYVVKATISWSKLLGIIQKYLPGEPSCA